MSIFKGDRNEIKFLEAEVHLQADTETVNQNVLVFSGPIEIIDQFAEITEVTNMTNMTNVYADLYDGTNSVALTDGVDMSDLVVGSIFGKAKVASEAYEILKADQVRLYEPVTDRRINNPFLINGKYGVDSYIRFNYTTNTTLDIKMKIVFQYKRLDSGIISLVS